MAHAEKGYAFFDHTADIGIRAQGSTLSELFTRMAQGLVELIAEDSRLEPRQTRPLELRAKEASALLLHFLQELLFWFSTDRFVPVDYRIEVTPTTVRGEVRGDTFEPSRHIQGREVKAITRHLLEAKQQDHRWHGQVIVDI